MIVVDTSIWIEFLKAKSPLFSRLKEQLEQQQVLALGCVFGELLQGARDHEEKNILTQYWRNLPKIEETGLWIDAGILSFQNKFFSKGVGLIDAFLLAAARKHKAAIWTLDKKLKSVLKPEEIYMPAPQFP